MSRKNKAIEELLLAEEEQPYELPQNWVWTTIGEITTFVGSGSTPKGGSKIYQTQGIPFVRSQNVLRNKMSIADIVYISQDIHDSMKRTQMHGNETLLNITGASIGRSVKLKKELVPCNINQHVCALRFIDGINEELPQYWLNSPYLQKIINEWQIGVTRQALNFPQVKSLPIPLPPLKEQKRIAEKVQRLLSKIEEAMQLIKEAKETFEIRRAAILDKAFCGELTAKWREDNFVKINIESYDKVENGNYNIPENWLWVKLKDVCLKITDGTHHSPKSFPTGDFMYITAKNIKEDGIDLSNITFVNKEVHHEIYSRCDVKINDVLYIKDGATTGVATVNTIDEEFSLLSSVGVIRPNQELLDSYYLKYCLNSPRIKEYMLGNMSGIAIRRLTLKKIKESFIPLPPLSEQKRIVSILQNIEEKDSHFVKAIDLKDKLEIIKQSILSKAFRGELSTNDPNEESALELLKEIWFEKAGR
jgi:type I restriction enzyme, S subunit